MKQARPSLWNDEAPDWMLLGVSGGFRKQASAFIDGPRGLPSNPRNCQESVIRGSTHVDPGHTAVCEAAVTAPAGARAAVGAGVRPTWLHGGTNTRPYPWPLTAAVVCIVHFWVWRLLRAPNCAEYVRFLSWIKAIPTPIHSKHLVVLVQWPPDV